MNNKDGFSIITPTCRAGGIENIINNYLRQKFPNKELIIIINNDKIKLDGVKNLVKDYENIYVYKCPEIISLGECLNYAVEKSNYKFISKFDDDDYYGRFYLEEAYDAFLKNNCHIVGKLDVYYYFEEFKKLMLLVKNKENAYYYMGTGSTICFKKEVFKDLKFRDLNKGEDANFYKDCLKMGYKLYITSKYNHLIFRSSNYNSHTYKSPPSHIMRYCKTIETNISLNKCYKLIDKKLNYN